MKQASLPANGTFGMFFVNNFLINERTWSRYAQDMQSLLVVPVLNCW